MWLFMISDLFRASVHGFVDSNDSSYVFVASKVFELCFVSHGTLNNFTTADFLPHVS